MEYTAIVTCTVEKRIVVEADSFEEAENKVYEAFDDADLNNGTKIYDTDIYSIEDEDGNTEDDL